MVYVKGICDYCGIKSNWLKVVEFERKACPKCMKTGYGSSFGEM